MNWLPVLNGLRDIVIVVFLGYGLKLMKQQVELLEREKALKQSEIEMHKANIEHLKTLLAPAIARDLEQMVRTADELAKGKRKLEVRVSELAAENKAIEGMSDLSELHGIAAGCMEAVAILQNSVRLTAVETALAGQPATNDLPLKKLEESISRIGKVADQALKGERPEFKEFKQWMDRVKGRPA